MSGRKLDFITAAAAGVLAAFAAVSYVAGVVNVSELIAAELAAVGALVALYLIRQ